jgi:UDP-3-O-[3-hydroxymyristoyl] N-acetylglucosamine deacetylase
MAVPHTLAKSFVVEGIGLHTGASARVAVHPAPASRGRIFVRDGVEIPALADCVVETRRCVTLGRDDARVSTVEHLLAALALAGVDNAEIVVEGPELPALDGAAQHWLQAIREAGICPQAGEVAYYTVTEPCWVEEGDSALLLTPAAELTLYAVLTIPETVAEKMTAGGVVAQMAEEIARARTFGLEREVAALREAGLAQGGSLENAVVLTRDGYLNPRVWPREPAWHKVLDLLGDLALLGRPLRGMVVAIRTGHRHHVALARRLREELA